MDTDLREQLLQLRRQLEASLPDDIVEVSGKDGPVSTHKTVREWLEDLRHAEQLLGMSGCVSARAE